MRLADRTDFALRLLMLLAASERRHAVADAAECLGVSANHLSKVVQALQAEGWVSTSRGRGGGVELSARARELQVGKIVRAMEPDFGVVECFRERGFCSLEGACGLQGVLESARQAFLAELDAVTLEDLVRGRKRELVRVTLGSN